MFNRVNLWKLYSSFLSRCILIHIFYFLNCQGKKKHEELLKASIKILWLCDGSIECSYKKINSTGWKKFERVFQFINHYLKLWNKCNNIMISNMYTDTSVSLISRINIIFATQNENIIQALVAEPWMQPLFCTHRKISLGEKMWRVW